MDLLNVLDKMPRNPCDKFKCQWKTACALGLACESFAIYVETGRTNNFPTPPNVEFYRVAFEVKP